MSNSVFGKTMENIRKHRDIKLVTTEEQRSKLVSQPNYHTTKYFTENLLGIEMKKAKVTMNKPLYLGMAILDISKTLMYKFWYDYIIPKYRETAKLCYTDTDSFITHAFTDDFFEDIADDVKIWFDTSSYDENDKIPLTIGQNKKEPGIFKDELGGKIMKEFCTFRPKAYAYLIDDGGEKDKAKETKKCVIKRNIKFEDYKDWLFNNEIILKSQQIFKGDYHNVYTITKIALGSNDDKRLRTFDRVTTYPYGAPAVKVCESEMMVVRDLFVERYIDCPFYGKIVLKR